MTSYFQTAIATGDLDVFGRKRRRGFFLRTLPNVAFFLDGLSHLDSLIFPPTFAIFFLSTVFGFEVKYVKAIVIYSLLLWVANELPMLCVLYFRPAEERLRSHWVEMLLSKHVGMKKYKETCKYGCDIPSPDHVVAKFMNDYTLMNLRFRPVGDRMNFLFDNKNYESIAVENSKPHNMALLIMASIGAKIILDEQDTRRNERAIVVAGDILLMEAIKKDQKTARNIVRKIDKLEGGGQREVIRFFSKRIACNCLKQLYKEAKKVQPTRLGICAHCGPGKDRDNLMYCQRCGWVQYCSRDCQKAHWPEHKLVCETM
jgi:uncharacterized membrane protein YhaH (DUF805 family)